MRFHEMMQNRIQRADQDQQENKPRDSVQNVDEAHHQRIGPSTNVASNHAVDDSDNKTDRRSRDPDDQRNSRPQQNSVQQIATVKVGSERMLLGWRQKAVAGYLG